MTGYDVQLPGLFDPLTNNGRNADGVDSGVTPNHVHQTGQLW